MGSIATLADMELAVRQDLNDTDASSYRWTGDVLDRCIARAVEEYSLAWPRLQGIVLPVVAGVRAYASPSPATLALPAVPTLTTLGSGGSLPAGGVFVKVTAAAGSSETAPSAEASVDVVGGGSIAVDIGAVVGAQRYNVYAGPAPGAEVWNGVTTVAGAGAYTITSLGASGAGGAETTPPSSRAQPLRLSEPVASSQAWWIEEVELPAGCWPPRIAPFEEQGGLFVLDVSPGRLPADGSAVMNVVYAAAHQLDATGTTLPDYDTDLIALGAYGYACLQYGTPAADNFRFQDGEMRDMLDDSMVPGMWREQSQDALARFQSRLDAIRRRRDYQAAAVAHWGDVQRRWDRL